MKKALMYLPIVAFSAYILQNMLPGMGLAGLFEGISTGNYLTLMIPEFLYWSAFAFFLFGGCEAYLYGYGKYVLLRRQKRASLLWRLTADIVAVAMLFTVARVAFYALFLAVRGRTVVDVTAAELWQYLALSALSMVVIGTLQMCLEIAFSSNTGLIGNFAYCVVSIVIGGVCLENGAPLPVLLMTPNFPMRHRVEPLEAAWGAEPTLWLLFLLPLVYIVGLQLFTAQKMKHKDIF